MEMQSYQRRTWAEIDLAALENNYGVLRQATPKETKICCVVKADGYGHGAVEASRLYESLGADWLAVSNVEEALQLREAGIKMPILVLGYTPPKAAAFLSKYDVSQCVMSKEYGKALAKEAQKAGASVKIHIKLDTGMGRIGFPCKRRDDCPEANETFARSIAEISELIGEGGLLPEGIFTHFASADEGDEGDDYTAYQLDNFNCAIRALGERGINFKIKHAAASSALLDHPEAAFDMVRCGIALYGVLPSDSIRNQVDGLMPAMKLKTVVIQVKRLYEGEYVNYGRTYQADDERIVATLPIGYADGFLRRNSRIGTEIEIKGKRARLVGRVCMDQCVIDVTDVEGVREGDEATVFGGDVSVEELALLNHTIPYEIFCGLSKRIPRVYVKNGEITHIDDHIFNL
jgi:alanine racemase